MVLSHCLPLILRALPDPSLHPLLSMCSLSPSLSLSLSLGWILWNR